jgi:hypothetical protein
LLWSVGARVAFTAGVGSGIVGTGKGSRLCEFLQSC